MKNKFEIRGSVTAIKVQHKGVWMECLIDTADLGFVQSASAGHTWGLVPKKNGTFYCGSQLIKGHMTYIHRLLMGFPSGKDVDHVNHDGLTNTRENLRAVPHSINLLNRRGAQPRTASGIRGVHWVKSRGTWAARVNVGGKVTQAGAFHSKDMAAQAVSALRKSLGCLE